MSHEVQERGRPKNLLDSRSLEGQQIGHELGVHSRKVGLGDGLCETGRGLLQLRRECQGECRGQRVQLNLRKAAHALD